MKFFLGCRCCGEIYECISSDSNKRYDCDKCFIFSDHCCDKKDNKKPDAYAGLCPKCFKTIMCQMAEREEKNGRNMCQMRIDNKS